MNLKVWNIVFNTIKPLNILCYYENLPLPPPNYNTNAFSGVQQ